MANQYRIEVEVVGSWPATARRALQNAIDRWERVIDRRLPPVTVDGRRIDNLLVFVSAVDEDGQGGAFARAGPVYLRPLEAGESAYLPATGELYLDRSDIANLDDDGRLDSVMIHELGHVLGIGSIWADKGLLRGAGTRNPEFTGRSAMAEYGRMQGGRPARVPVENKGGVGASDCHWRETVFGNELMSTYVATATNPLSALTIASLADLGYSVRTEAADPYDKPTERFGGGWSADSNLWPRGYRIRPTRPKVLPPDSLSVPADGSDPQKN